MSKQVLLTTQFRAAEADTAQQRFIELQQKLLDHYGVQAKSRYVHLQEPRLRAHILEAGQGEPVVIFHGGDGEAVNWVPLMAPLQGRLHLFATDRPGFGLTDPFDYRRVDLRSHAANFVRSLLDALELESATLMGGSMGGFFALAAALAHPHRVKKLILVGMPAGISKSGSLPLRIICGVPGLAKLFMAGRPSMKNQRQQYEKMFHVDLTKVPDLYLETRRIAGVSLPGAQETWAVLLPRLVNLNGFRPEVNLANELPHLEQPTPGMMT
ncbi:MAG: alpha/beta fold hydrolase [Anaerolineales bacterium]|nr:alpha/beta fold hydrolase [Anaerolineales bacterium]